MRMVIKVFILFTTIISVFPALGSCESHTLVIEDFRTGKELFSSQIRERFLTYQFPHSVFGDNVKQVYSVTPDKKFLLTQVISTPRVLSSPYPGFELSIPLEKSNANVLSLPLKELHDELLLVVGSENLFLLQGGEIRLNEVTNEGTIVRIYLK